MRYSSFLTIKTGKSEAYLPKDVIGYGHFLVLSIICYMNKWLGTCLLRDNNGDEMNCNEYKLYSTQ